MLLGGGNAEKLAEKLKTLPPRCRLGGNDDAFSGGVRLWHSALKGSPARPAARPLSPAR